MEEDKKKERTRKNQEKINKQTSGNSGPDEQEKGNESGSTASADEGEHDSESQIPPSQ